MPVGLDTKCFVEEGYGISLGEKKLKWKEGEDGALPGLPAAELPTLPPGTSRMFPRSAHFSTISSPAKTDPKSEAPESTDPPASNSTMQALDDQGDDPWVTILHMEWLP